MRAPLTSFESHVREIVQATRARDDVKVRTLCRTIAKLAALKEHPSIERAANHLAQQVTRFPASSRERVDALLALTFEVTQVEPAQNASRMA